MIPADIASRLKLAIPDQPAPAQPATPAEKLTDVLSDLVPGQRIMAEIQALLPNGTYRAVVAQRDITLALPFSAKAGDALELEVVENDGKLSLAFVANRSPAPEAEKGDSVATNLSQAGKLIGNLLAQIDKGGKNPQPTPLNGNQPLVGAFPKEAAELAPVLKEALSKSGMFYESHQARWVEGKLPIAALLQEPQGKLSAPRSLPLPLTMPAGLPLENRMDIGSTGHAWSLEAERIAAPPLPPDHPPPENQHTLEEAPSTPATPHSPSESSILSSKEPPASLAPPATTAAPISSASSDSTAPRPLSSQDAIPPDLAPLVGKQLDALATQNYVWQGQVWPGQQMQWEIEADNRGRQAEDGSGQQWRTRLKLSLPGLGGVAATLRLSASGTLDVAVVTDSDESRRRLLAAGEGLRQHLQDAGLNLTGLAVQHGEIPG